MSAFIGGNQIQLLRNGTEYFPALEAAIEHARYEVYLQTYIYEPDNIGIRIGEALKRAAQRGVTVNILLDGFGCRNLPANFVKALEAAGVKIMFYRPKISPWTFKKSRLRRMHRKVAVIDGKIGFVGGINIIDDYNVPGNIPPRIDYAVRVEGKLIPVILKSASKLWRRISFTHLQADSLKSPLGKPPSPIGLSADLILPSTTHTVKAAFVLRDNVLNRRSIENAYLIAIAQAQAEIIIANAYFIPGKSFRTALMAAAKRGVKVKLLLQGRMEYFLMFATHAYYASFLESGIEIYEYRKGFMHSKVAVIDNEWATVGSSNIDPFSLLLAREANIIVKDRHFASELRADIMRDIKESAYHVLPKEWSNRHILNRFASRFAHGIVRWFVGLVGNSREE